MAKLFLNLVLQKKSYGLLLDRFLPKITDIEESKNLDSLTENELIGSLQTFESNRLSKYKTQKKNVDL